MKLGNYYIDFLHNVTDKNSLCVIYKDKNRDKIISQGTAFCYYKDQFNKKIARKVSLTKTIKELNLSKEERKQIWYDYFKYCKK